MSERNSPVRLLRHLPNSPGRLDRWEEFEAKARARLEAGAREYGDQSFTKGIPYVFAQLKEELLDLAGWGYVGYERIRELEERLKAEGFHGLGAADDSDPPAPDR